MRKRWARAAFVVSTLRTGDRVGPVDDVHIAHQTPGDSPSQARPRA
ncbi:MAG: hypothetical protein M3P85_01550 [Actinomycetota bacterium]|nr:hypothetical protein [Actinomycetota bacterium]